MSERARECGEEYSDEIAEKLRRANRYRGRVRDSQAATRQIEWAREGETYGEAPPPLASFFESPLFSHLTYQFSVPPHTTA